MKINVYSVFDVKSAVFAHPFYMAADGVAVRAFGGAVNEPDSLMCRHPSDFSLYRIGQFDDSVGLLIAEKQPVALCTAASVKNVPAVLTDSLPLGGLGGK